MSPMPALLQGSGDSVSSSLLSGGFLLDVGIFTGAVLVFLMLWSYMNPARRFWPPGKRDWRWATYWVLAAGWTVSFVLAGIFSGGGFMLERIVPEVVGLLVLAVGIAGSAIAVIQLGRERTEGVGASLRKEGLYAYSRNPQVVANIVAVLGYVLLAGNTATLVIGVVGTIWIGMMPFVEEPWLEERFGEEYDRYREDVPRFL